MAGLDLLAAVAAARGDPAAGRGHFAGDAELASAPGIAGGLFNGKCAAIEVGRGGRARVAFDAGPPFGDQLGA